MAITVNPKYQKRFISYSRTPKTDLETLLHSIRIGILTANPPAQLDFARWNVRYMLQEARDAYGRQMSRHARDGWKADESMGKWLK